MTLPGVTESPNIWRWPDVYEAENAAQDATGALWEALEEIVDLDGADLVDVGCGDGYHLPRLATRARARRRSSPLSDAGRIAAR